MTDASHPASTRLRQLLAPQRPAAGDVVHVFTIRNDTYEIRALPDTGEGPVIEDFWWRTRGRVLHTTLLDERYTGLHIVITYFHFISPRAEVFRTVHITADTTNCLNTTDHERRAGEAHAAAVAHLEAVTPLVNPHAHPNP